LTRGIYLIANRRSEKDCRNLIYSIRRCGCQLPVRIIPFGGTPIRVDPEWQDVRLVSQSEFPAEGLAFIDELHRRIPQCPVGFLRRFLCWYGEFDEFLYSDNDIVALMNWGDLFDYLGQYELVHADLEYTTKGMFNMRQPARFEQLMGAGALEVAVTAGHFLCGPKANHRGDLLAGLAWMEQHRDVPFWHDQALLHVTLAIAKWPALNLCKPPHNWGCSHAGSYANSLDIIRTIQAGNTPISHLHFSGGVPSGTRPIEELLYSDRTPAQRKRELLRALLSEATGVSSTRQFFKRAARGLKRRFRNSA
jgi:hypothetical protein